MKKLVIFLLLGLPFITKAHFYTSVALGGNWGTAATWTGGPSFPGSADTAIINSAVTINAAESVLRVVIIGGQTLTISGTVTLSVLGNFINGGTLSAGSGTVSFGSSVDVTQMISGVTTFNNLTIAMHAAADTVFLGNNITVNGTLTISKGVFDCDTNQVAGSGGSLSMSSSGTTMVLGLTSSAKNIVFPTGFGSIGLNMASVVVYQTNGSQTISTAPSYGNLKLTTGTSSGTKTPSPGPTLTVGATLGITGKALLNATTNTINTGPLTIAASAQLSFSTGALNMGGSLTNNGTFTAGTSLVTCTGASAQTLGGTTPTRFYDLTIASGSNTVTLGNNDTVADNLTISSGTLDASASGNFNLAVKKNFTNNSSFLCQGGTVTMNGAVNQTIGGTGTLTFNNLTTFQGASTDTVFMSKNITVNKSLTVTRGVFDCQTNQVTGNATGLLSMVAGTSLVLGLKSSITKDSFPTFYSGSHVSLDQGSTVVYQANAAQTVSSNPNVAYGNLIVSTGSTPTIKTTFTSSLVVAGSLTINSGNTLNGISGKLTLGGNFTNNGRYIVGTDTVLFDGLNPSAQIIGGSVQDTFCNITIANTGGGSIKPTYNLVISKNLSITSGTLDVTASNYNMKIGGNFTESGVSALSANNDTVFMDGSSQILGGSTTIYLNKLIIFSGTTTLGGNIAAASDITIKGGTTFDASAYDINIAGNFTDDGTFNCNTGTVDFDNNGNQCVSGVHSSETFQNLTVSALSKLGTSCIINIDGTILIMPGGQMACVCH